MRVDYVPNEKYRNMFGVERNGYGMERVDLYLAQLEVAFKKIREDNRNLKRELSERTNVHPGLAPADNAALQQSEYYIAQLQSQLGGEQEQNRLLREQIMQEQDQARLLHEQMAELQAQIRQFSAGQPMTEDLITQIQALRAEADDLRRQLSVQPRQPHYEAPRPNMSAVLDDDLHTAIGKVLVDARQQAEETLEEARAEAEQITRRARQRVEELRGERDRVYNQLQGISFSVRNVLRESGESEYKQRSEEFVAS